MNNTTKYNFGNGTSGGEIEDTGTDITNTTSASVNKTDEVLSVPKSMMANPYLVAAALTIVLQEIHGENLDINIQSLNLSEESPYTSEELGELKQYLSKLPNLEGLAQRGGVDRVNIFLKEKGFSIQLAEIGSTDIAVVVVNKMDVTFKNPGNKTQITLENSEKEVPGSTFDKVVLFDQRDSFTGNHIVFIPTTDGYFVVSKMDNSMDEGDMFRSVRDFTADVMGAKVSGNTSGKVTFPMIDLKLETELSYLLGLDLGNDFFISQAKAESILKVNNERALSKAAVAIATTRGIAPPVQHIEVDGSFIAWFVTDDGIAVDPYFITEEHMSEPDFSDDE